VPHLSTINHSLIQLRPKTKIFWSVFHPFILGFLEQQMSLVVFYLNFDIKWKIYFYASQSIKSVPAKQSDCFAECYYIRTDSCQFFTLIDSTCYLGMFNFTNGTMMEIKQLSVVLSKFPDNTTIVVLILISTIFYIINLMNRTSLIF